MSNWKYKINQIKWRLAYSSLSPTWLKGLFAWNDMAVRGLDSPHFWGLEARDEQFPFKQNSFDYWRKLPKNFHIFLKPFLQKCIKMDVFDPEDEEDSGSLYWTAAHCGDVKTMRVLEDAGLSVNFEYMRKRFNEFLTNIKEQLAQTEADLNNARESKNKKEIKQLRKKLKSQKAYFVRAERGYQHLMTFQQTKEQRDRGREIKRKVDAKTYIFDFVIHKKSTPFRDILWPKLPIKAFMSMLIRQGFNERGSDEKTLYQEAALSGHTRLMCVMDDAGLYACRESVQNEVDQVLRNMRRQHEEVYRKILSSKSQKKWLHMLRYQWQYMQQSGYIRHLQKSHNYLASVIQGINEYNARENARREKEKRERLLQLNYGPVDRVPQIVTKIRYLVENEGADVNAGINGRSETTPVTKAWVGHNYEAFYELIRLGANLSVDSLNLYYYAKQAREKYYNGRGEEGWGEWYLTSMERWLLKNASFFCWLKEERENIQAPVPMAPATSTTAQRYRCADGDILEMPFPNPETPEETAAMEKRRKIEEHKAHVKYMRLAKAADPFRQEGIRELHKAAAHPDKKVARELMRLVVRDYGGKRLETANGVYERNFRKFGDNEYHLVVRADSYGYPHSGSHGHRSSHSSHSSYYGFRMFHHIATRGHP